jgi:hypothetical protein
MVRPLLLFVGLFVSTNVLAGVTIHFKGQVTNAAAIEKIKSSACEIAKAHSWRCDPVSDPKSPVLDHITTQSLQELDGTSNLSVANGVVIYPADMSEPLYLVFGASNKLDNFVKTQFSGPETHLGVIEIFDSIKPFFLSLEIEDEGRYWETRNRALLEEDMGSVSAQIEAIKEQRPNVTGPVKRPDGRILDLVGK